MECPVEIIEQFADVSFGALHGRQAARVLAREGFGARAEERDKEIFANEGTEGYGAAPHDLRQLPGRPTHFDQTLPPLCVEGQHPLTHRLVESSWLGAIMED